MNEKEKILGEYKKKLNQLKIHSANFILLMITLKISYAEFDKLKSVL